MPTEPKFVRISKEIHDKLIKLRNDLILYGVIRPKSMINDRFIPTLNEKYPFSFGNIIDILIQYWDEVG